MAGGRERDGVTVAAVPAAGDRPVRLVFGTSDPAGGVGVFDAGGRRLFRGRGSDESFLAAGPFVG